MNESDAILKVRMVVFPLPPKLRVASHSWQFPVFQISPHAIRFLDQTFPMNEIDGLSCDGSAIRFNVKGKQYAYAAQSYSSKDESDPMLTVLLFNVLIALKSDSHHELEQSLLEFKKTQRKHRGDMWVMAAVLILLAIVCAVVVGL